MKKQDI